MKLDEILSLLENEPNYDDIAQAKKELKQFIDDIVDIQQQLAATCNDPNLTITCVHRFEYPNTY